MEKDDNFQYWGLDLYGDTVKFLIDALKFYSDLLRRDLDTLQHDADLGSLLDMEEVHSPLRRELGRVSRAIKLLDENWDKNVHGLGAMLNLSHGSVRFLKSVGLAYISHLRSRRNEVGGRAVVSESILSEIDRQIARFQEKMTLARLSQNKSHCSRYITVTIDFNTVS